MPPLISILIPTWNNPEFLNPCIDSIAQTGVLNGLAELIIVNNGKQPIKDYVGDTPHIKVLEPGKNLGWEGGLAYGCEESEAPFLCFQNDDTHIPRANFKFYENLLMPFADANVGAVGPATTMASGWHSIFNKNALIVPTEVSYLIFFTVMIRRAHYDLVGGIDVTAPGGDDFDLSIRLRKAGKKLVINPGAFLIHHGFKTGTRVRGDNTVAGGWNSSEMTDKTNQWLIRKHGFKTFIETRIGLRYETTKTPPNDLEGKTVRQLVTGERIIELGCGAQKTVPNSIGVDRVAQGESIPHVGNGCVADVNADVTQELPFPGLSFDTAIARHILEHCLDTVQTLKNWNRVLRMGGRLIIAVPNQEICNSIPMNPEHIHAFTPSSLNSLMELCGFHQVEVRDPKNGISFVGCYIKVLHMAPIERQELALV